jgi:hypothetical protein
LPLDQVAFVARRLTWQRTKGTLGQQPEMTSQDGISVGGIEAIAFHKFRCEVPQPLLQPAGDQPFVDAGR